MCDYRVTEELALDHVMPIAVGYWGTVRKLNVVI